MSFNDKVVIVTGAGSGNGAGIAYLFAREAANVVLVGRTEVKLKATAEKCETFGRKPLVLPADVSKDNDAKEIIEKTVQKFGKIDVLINNAAVLRDGSMLDGSVMQVYDEVLNTNLRAAVFLTSLAAPHLMKTKGNVVNISSVASVMTPAVSQHISYYIAKAGLNHFTRCAALEFAPHVRVNTAMFGLVKTDLLINAGYKDMKLEDFKDSVALKRISEPEEVGELVLFLASDKAKSITGIVFSADNGATL
ncbi:3-oxoacyl-[acyl-carrier-protein] reductase FabG-like [Choristoneura fumiferana]|uniref:3-oxoacyl-[acyl-carrier-protein] reductase FabG-like n=1 Tax=Choristoneura fumiferana TaxID=7141 RepID=UPI003D15E79D